MSLDPGYVFFPADIQYFIDFERQDRARREQIATDTGVPISSVSRQVPTSADYKQHEVGSDLISPAAIGGRYSRVFLKQYLHSGRIPGIEKAFSTAKEWHGAPLASIRRAFAALSSPRFFMIVDTKTHHLLEELRQLYFSDDHLPLNKSLYATYIDLRSGRVRSTSWMRLLMSRDNMPRKPNIKIQGLLEHPQQQASTTAIPTSGF